jgi:hypothetical protein
MHLVMKQIIFVITLIIMSGAAADAQKPRKIVARKAIAVAFIDEQRLQGQNGRTAKENFEFFLKPIQEILKRDFPGVELRIAKGSELIRLPDGTALNIRNLQPELGYVLSAGGKNRQILSGVQTDADFACAAAAYFKRSSAACPS